MDQWINRELYQLICKAIPIPTVDVVLFWDKKVLLVKRNREPAKGEWWTPGGRQYLNETIEEASKRKLLEEVGIDNVNIVGSMGSVDVIFKERHNVTSVVLARVISEPVVRLNKDHSDYKWIDDFKDATLHLDVIRILSYIL